MGKLFTKRHQRYLLHLVKYLRLVFNDQFTIALFFLFGALAYAYAQWLATLGPGLWWPRWALALFLTVWVQLGRPATLVQPADPVFLLPRTSSMQAYFSRALIHSSLIGGLISLIGLLIAWPLARTTIKLDSLALGTLALTMLALKGGNLLMLALKNRQLASGTRRLLTLLIGGEPLVVLLVAWLGHPGIGLILALLALGIHALVLKRAPAYDWRYLIAGEAARMERIYRFFNLFTDVPAVQGRVKRRRWASGLINWLGRGSAWGALDARALVRNSDQAGLITRLTLVFALILLVTPVAWLKAALLALALYVLASQLVPLASHYDTKVFPRLFPRGPVEKQAAFMRVAGHTLTMAAAVLVLASLGLKPNLVQLGVALVIALIEVPLLVRGYFPRRLHNQLSK